MTSEHVGRRGALAVGLAALVLVLLPACGGDDDSADSASEPSSDSDSGSGSDGAVDVDDQRVVVLAEEFVLADVLDLGIRPVASTASVEAVGFQGLDDDTSDIEVLPMTTLSMEHLASLRPDVIVTLQFWVDQAGEDTLRGMGELLIVPDGLTVAERLTTLGDLLGRPDEAAAVVAELDEATEPAREAVPDDCRVSLAAIYPGPSPAAFVAGPWDLPTSVLATGCTLDPDPSVAEPDENGRVYLSLEQLGMLDAPTLVLLQSETVDGEEEAVDQIEANPLWPELPAVRDDNVVVFDRLGYPGARGQIRFLEDFTAVFG